MFDSHSVSILTKITYSFNMPVFIFVTGYFAKLKPDKVVKNILLPYLLIQLISYLFYNNVVSVQMDFHLIYANPTLWYMISLFCWYLLVPVLDSSKKPIITIIILIVLGLVIGYDKSADHTFSISRTIVFLPVFALGYYTKKYNWRLTRKTILSKIFCLVFIGILIFTIVKYGQYINVEVFMAQSGYFVKNSTIITRLIYYIVMYFWIIVFYNFVSSKKNIFSYIGKNTLTIYLLHYFIVYALKRSELLFIGSYPILNCFMYSTIILIILSPNIISKYFRKIFCFDFKKKESNME